MGRHFLYHCKKTKMNDENKIIQRLSAIYGGDMGKMLEAIRFFKINGFLPKWSNVADAVTNMCNTADSLVGRESHDALIDNIRSGPAPLYDYGQTLLKEYPSSTSSGGGAFGGSGASSSWSVDIGNPGPYDYVENIPLLDRMTFSDAYSAARRAGIGEFEFDGRTYSTDYDPNATLGPVQMGESLVGNLRNVYDADGRIIRDSTRVEPWMGQIPGRHKREHAQGGTLLLPYNKFEMEGPENGIGENTESAQQASERKHENFYRRFSDKYGVLYDVANAVLYAAAPYTGGTTLPLAVLMSGAQGAGGIYDMIDNGPDWNNAIDVTSAIPGLGISQSVVKSLAKKGISKAITKNVASNVDPFSLMRVARKVAKIENVSNHALNAAQLMNDFYDMKTGKKVSEAPLLESAPPVFSGPVNVGYVTISGANPEYEELFTRGVGLKNEYQDNYRNREWSSGSIHFGGETVDFDYGYGNNYYGGAKVPVEILDYIYNASADNNIPFKALLGLAGKESTLGYGSIRQRQDLKDSISPLRLFNYDHGIGQSDIVLAKDMKRFYDILNKYYNAEKITEEDADVFSSVVDKIERENGLLHDYTGDNFVKDMWDYYQNSGMWNKSNGFRNDVLKKGEEAFGNPAFRKWWESRGYSLNNDGVAVKKVR